MCSSCHVMCALDKYTGGVRCRWERQARASSSDLNERDSIEGYSLRLCAIWAAEQLPAKRPPPVACARAMGQRATRGAALGDTLALRKYRGDARRRGRQPLLWRRPERLCRSLVVNPERLLAPAGAGRGAGDVLIHAASRTTRGKGYSKGTQRVLKGCSSRLCAPWARPGAP